MKILHVRQTLDLLTWLGCLSCDTQKIGDFDVMLVTENQNIPVNHRFRLESMIAASVSEGDTLAGNEVFRERGTQQVTVVVPAAGSGGDDGTDTRQIAYQSAEKIVAMFKHGRRFRVPDIMPVIEPPAAGTSLQDRSDIVDNGVDAMIAVPSDGFVNGQGAAITVFAGASDQNKLGQTGNIAITSPPHIAPEFIDVDTLRLPVMIEYVATAYGTEVRG